MKKHAVIAVTLITALLCESSGFHGYSTAESGSLEQFAQTISVVSDTDAYASNQILVQYMDGSCEVLQCSSKETLAKTIATLKENDEIAVIQPNYEYTMFGTTVSDPEYSNQWALHNDGSFSIQDETDEYPIYSNPFEDPWNMNPGQDNRFNNGWDPRQGAGSHGFMKNSYNWVSQLTTQSTTAVSGIDIDMEDAWSVYDGGKRDVIVAVIDTGIDYSHEDLKDAIWVNEDEIAGDGIDNDGNGYIDDVYGWNFYDNSNEVYTGTEDNHGTHGAGTIAASKNSTGIAGIAGDSTVSVMSVKALGGESGSGTTEAIIAAIEYAEANGASICNLSFGTTTDDTALRNAIKNSNMLFIAAAGNGDNWTGQGQNSDRTPVYPAAYSFNNVISVANLNFDGTLHSSSNYGSVSVDLAAPGSYILSTTADNTYSYMTGTSMAAPMVTGTAALIYSYYDTITLSQVREILLNSVTKLDSLSGKVATEGMLNVYQALTYDLDSLSSETDRSTDSDLETTSSAPVITAEYFERRGSKYVTITITDGDDDLLAACYQKGSLDASAFDSGATGTSIGLISSSTNSITFRYQGTQTYTFYAIDNEGNETLNVISLK